MDIIALPRFTCVNGRSQRPRWQVVYSVTGLADAEHTLVAIKRTGAYATIDGFRLEKPVSAADARP